MFTNTFKITAKKALTSIVAAMALVTLVVPAAHATFDRSLPTKNLHAKVTKTAKVAKHKVAKPMKVKSNTSSSTSDSSSAASAPTEQQLCELGDYCVLLTSSSTIGVSAPAPVTYNVEAGT
jgi:hypothetical protein